MNQATKWVPTGAIEYPSGDGKPLAENTLQLRWIVTLYGNLAAQYRDTPDVFVGADQLWYPVEGEPKTNVAPDVYVVFGRPKGERPSWKQWEEAGTPLTVVFEVLSPGNSHAEMIKKMSFYEDHGVEEYYEYDPDANALFAYLRRGEMLRRVKPTAAGFVSPRLGVRFDLSGDEMAVFGPNGERFLTFEDAVAQREEAVAQREEAVAQRESGRAELERSRERSARMAELGRKARKGQAAAEELAELERLEDEAAA